MKKPNFSRLRTHYPTWTLTWVITLALAFYMLKFFQLSSYFFTALKILLVFFLFKDTVVDLIFLKRAHWPKDLEHCPLSIICILLGLWNYDLILIVLGLIDSVIDFIDDIELLNFGK